MRQLLRPPPHRGPLIAAGVVLLAVGAALVQQRLDRDLWHAVAAAVVAVLGLGLGLQARSDQGAPYAFQSVLLVTGCLALTWALGRGIEVLGVDPLEERWATLLVALLAGGAAAAAAFARESAACLLLAATAAVVALLSLWDLVFDPRSATPYRWLLVLAAAAFVLVALVLRGSRYRHSVQMVNAAGLCLVAMCASHVGFPLFLFGFQAEVGIGWEFIALACGCGLIAFGAVDRQPGPALLGIAVLGLFVAMVGAEEDTLIGWPLFVLTLGALVVAAGLRPRRPLPPEPAAYRSGDLPLAARSEDDEPTITSVRVE